MGIQHEDPHAISDAAKDLIRARDSIVEELQAQNWYDEIEWLTKKDPEMAKSFQEHDAV
jgi:hypothetical protein